MHETKGHIEVTESSGAFGAPRIPTRPITWSMKAKAKPYKSSEFESVLVAIAGHDLRQPLQVIQSAHEIRCRGVRMTSELRQLRTGQSAIDRLRDQLDELVVALQLREHAKGVKLTPVRVSPLLERATYEDEVAAQTKGVSVRTAPTREPNELPRPAWNDHVVNRRFVSVLRHPDKNFTISAAAELQTLGYRTWG
jgi:two-component system, OmpR family, phosphate regulon sensor histidine kinase PhoR